MMPDTLNLTLNGGSEPAINVLMDEVSDSVGEYTVSVDRVRRRPTAGGHHHALWCRIIRGRATGYYFYVSMPFDESLDTKRTIYALGGACGTVGAKTPQDFLNKTFTLCIERAMDGFVITCVKKFDNQTTPDWNNDIINNKLGVTKHQPKNGVYMLGGIPHV